MKKALLFSVLIILLVMPVMAEEGKFKLGLMAGSPSGITAGYRFSDLLEVNGIVGFGFGWYGSSAISLGGNLLFTVYTFDIGGHDFPLSIGPQATVNFGLDNYYDIFGFDAVADIRLEYTFEDKPWNLFIETGFGVKYYSFKWDLFGTIYDDEYIGFQFTGAVGARYVF